MSKVLKKWFDFREARIGVLRPWILCGLLFGISFSLLDNSEAGKILDQKLVQVLEFRLRSFWQKSPNLDPKLKIYFIDDRTVGSLKKDDLDLQDWSNFFQSIAKAKPRIIMIDKLFSTPRGNYDPERIQRELMQAGVPIASIVFLTDQAMQYAPPLPMHAAWSGHQWLKDSQAPWLAVQPKVPYGPHPDLQKAISFFGHGHYNGDGRTQLFFRIAPDVLIPHWSLFAAPNAELNDQGIRIGKKQVTEKTTEVLINFLDRDLIVKNALSLDRAFRRSEKNASFSKVVAEDQIVLILPAMFTGNSDMVDSPFGLIPGGFLMVSMVNSVVSGQWIDLIGPGWGEAILLSIVGVLAGIFLTPFAFVFAFVMGSLGMASLGIYLFCIWGIKIFWFIPTLAFCLMSLASFFWKIIRRDSKTKNLEQALADVIATDQLQKILKNPEIMVTQPSSQQVTIMFLDLVGFSLTSQRLTPQETFAQLKNLLKEAMFIIHRHEGVIDKTLGDGLLCFFGYNLLGQTQATHADQAVHCAMEIQRKFYDMCFQAYERGQGLYPARIGINSSQVYIGNIGNETRFDFTLIGDGVNFASRLESACEPFRIMIGSDTRDRLQTVDEGLFMTPRYVRVKHSTQLQKAWQVDPFQQIPNAIDRVEKLYWSYAKIERQEDRLEISALQVILRSEYCLFEMTDFSNTGLAFQGDIFLAKDVTLDVSFDIDDEMMMQQLRQWGLESFTIEVRWGKLYQNRFKHGARILGLNTIQRNRIFDLLKNMNRAAA